MHVHHDHYLNIWLNNQRDSEMAINQVHKILILVHGMWGEPNTIECLTHIRGLSLVAIPLVFPSRPSIAQGPLCKIIRQKQFNGI